MPREGGGAAVLGGGAGWYQGEHRRMVSMSALLTLHLDLVKEAVPTLGILCPTPRTGRRVCCLLSPLSRPLSPRWLCFSVTTLELPGPLLSAPRHLSDFFQL